MFSYIDEYIDTCKSRFKFSVGKVVYVNQRLFRSLSCRCWQHSDIGITVFADFWFLILEFSGIISFTLQLFNSKIYTASCHYKAKCYLGELLYGELLYGEMFYGEMLYGKMLLSLIFDMQNNWFQELSKKNVKQQKRYFLN